MNERVIEILVYIMSEIRNRRTGIGRLEALSQDLLQQGYSESEISSAFAWLFERMDEDLERLDEGFGATGHPTFRILHEAERAVIQPQAYGYLLQLHDLGIIDEAEMEAAIDRAMMLGTDTVDVDTMRSIVASILFNTDFPFGSSSLFFEGNTTIH
ncbi:MAG: DUF494 domain-containing protein [candidate division KSB1 bacterium]|nr:DUF494 domain-containing protein [candidate division KSB1 bacterium]